MTKKWSSEILADEKKIFGLKVRRKSFISGKCSIFLETLKNPHNKFLPTPLTVYVYHVFFVQITTLVNAKEKPIRSERALSALVRVGQAVNMAVERFVKVGEAIARENSEIQHEMYEACQEAKIAGKYP